MIVAFFYTINPRWLPKFITKGRDFGRKHTAGVAGILFVLFIVFIAISPTPEPTEEAAGQNETEYGNENDAVVETATNEPDPEPDESDSENDAGNEEIEPVPEEPAGPEYPDNVEFDVSFDFADDVVYIDGSTNLDDGIIVSYSAATLDDYFEASVELNNGQFTAEMDVSEFSDGEILVWAGIMSFEQPSEYQNIFEHVDEDLYGEDVFIKSNPIELAGTGDTATETFNLMQGFAVMDATHNGGSNFIVELKSMDGLRSELMVNEIGVYNGKTFVIIPESGGYLLDIDANGAWTANITQTIPADTEQEAETIEGTGDDVIFIELTSGLKRFEFTHDGQSNFIVMLNGQNLLVNEIGAYSGSTTGTVQDDAVYAIVINADGNWTAHVE